MKVRAIRPFRWAGDHVEPGTLLDVTEREARQLVYVYRDCVFVDEGELPQAAAVVVDADPVVQHRDPVRRGRR